MTAISIIHFIIYVIFSISTLMVLYRIAIGPSMADRVIAMDILLTIAICFVLLFAVTTKQAAYLDVAIIIAIIGFLGTIAFSYFINHVEKK